MLFLRQDQKYNNMILYPHCKINLGLGVTKRRDDGFHEISSLLYPVFGLRDMLEIVESEEFEFSTSGLAIDCPLDKNLCYRAYMLLKEKFGATPVKIHLHKVVPMGAGLGGGSSDATFVLKGINELLSLGASHEQIQELSLMLGSDTPFFLYDGAMMVAGRGDILSPYELDLAGWHITIVKKDVHISTKEAFGSITPKAMTVALEESLGMGVERWQEVLVNDFEAGIFALHPQLAKVKETLKELGASYVAMSGSGSAIFALSKHELGYTAGDNTFIYKGIL